MIALVFSGGFKGLKKIKKLLVHGQEL